MNLFAPPIHGPRLLLLAGAIFLLAAAPYLSTLSFPLVWDDPLLLENLRRAAEEGGLGGVLAAGWSYPGEGFGYWRPVTALSLWLTGLAGGGSPFLLHLGNVLLHALGAVALLLLGRRLLPPRAAALAALLFAFWPTHSESAAFVGNRHDLLACLFALLAALAWASDREGRRPWAVAGGAAATLLAGLSKESAFVLPLALLAWELVLPPWPPGPPGPPGSIRRPTLPARWLLAWGGAVGLGLALRVGAAGGGAVAPFSAGGEVAGLPHHPGLLLTVLVRYLGLLVVPWPVALYYSGKALPLTLPAAAGAALFVAAAAAAGGRRDGRFGWAMAAWVGVFLLPVSGILPIPGAVMAARHLTLPSAGSCLLLGLWLDRALGREGGGGVRRAAGILGTGVLLAALAWGTTVQSGVFRDDRSIALRVIADAPSEGLGYANLGVVLGREGRLLEAAAEFRRSLDREPDPTVFLNLAEVHRRMGDSSGELQVLLRARQAFPRSQAIQDRLQTVSKVQGPTSRAD